jgi:hypothetical protein
MLNFIKLRPLAFLLFFVAFTIGLFSRILAPQLAYTEFLGEQAREAFLHLQISQNGMVGFGPISSIGKYYIPNGYYILFYIFSFWSDNPNIHILSNSISSFLTIPLFGFLIYRAFAGFRKVVVVSVLASLIWSLFATDIFFAGFVWNPNSTSFFWMLLIVLYELILSKAIANKFVSLTWFAQGIIFGILTGLHSSALFIIPFVFLLNNLYVSLRLKSFKSLWSIFGFLTLEFIYLRADFLNEFKNTLAIIDTVFNQSKVSHTLTEKLNHLFDPIISLGNNVYFSQTQMPMLSFALVLVVILFGIVFYVGKKFYLVNYILILGLFLLASNSYWGALYSHYLVLIWSVPLFFAFSLLFIEYSSKIKKVISLSLIFLGFVFFIQQNLEGINNIYQNKFGQNRLVNLADMNLALEKLPLNSSICSITHGKSLDYINLVNENKLNLKIYDSCDNRSSFEFVQRYLNVDFAPAAKNTFDLSSKKVFYSSQAFDIINLE